MRCKAPPRSEREKSPRLQTLYGRPLDNRSLRKRWRSRTRRQLAREPAPAWAMQDLALSHNKVGKALLQVGRTREARTVLTEVIALWTPLTRTDAKVGMSSGTVSPQTARRPASGESARRNQRPSGFSTRDVKQSRSQGAPTWHDAGGGLFKSRTTRTRPTAASTQTCCQCARSHAPWSNG